MTNGEQQRAQVLTRLLVGEVTAREAALLLGLSEHPIFRLRRGLERDGPAALVHGNRGRPSSRRLDPDLAERILGLARTTYEGANDCHLAELLAEHEGIAIGSSSLRRLLRGAGRPSPRWRRAPRHRSRRDRVPQAGMLLQVDGSRHDWLEQRGPRLTPVSGIDDATGRLTGWCSASRRTSRATSSCSATPSAGTASRSRCYRDRHTLFETPRGSLMTLEEQLADTRVPTQLGRAFEELGITSIAARSPQAMGRIERAWGTLQDRLVTELRLAGAHDLPSANEVLARFLPRFNRRSTVPAADPAPAWRPLPPGTRIERVCCLKYAGSWPTTTPSAWGRPSSSRRPAPAGAAKWAAGSRSSCGSTGGPSCGTASTSCSRCQRGGPGPAAGPRVRPGRDRDGRPQRRYAVGHQAGPLPPLAPRADQRPARVDTTDRIIEQMT